MAELITTQSALRSSREPWVIVAGGFHTRGAMDKANLALASYLASLEHEVHLVAHDVDQQILRHPRVTVHNVPRPAASALLGEQLLSKRGVAVAQAVSHERPDTRVVVNGGNCVWPDINWVHSVHHAWLPADRAAPLWFKAKNRIAHSSACRNERRALNAARVIVTNSDRTRQDLIKYLYVDPTLIKVIYLGSDESCRDVDFHERRRARASLQIPTDRPVVAFVGALGHDANKGFDVLWSSWLALNARGDWDAELIVAGDGRGLPEWRARIADEQGPSTVRLLGFTERVPELLAAADLLVSPARYEAYGLNVQEAICRGLPALVSANAGIAERYPADLHEMLLTNSEDADELTSKLLRWRDNSAAWKIRFRPFATVLRRYHWEDMAEEFVGAVQLDQTTRVRQTLAHVVAQA